MEVHRPVFCLEVAILSQVAFCSIVHGYMPCTVTRSINYATESPPESQNPSTLYAKLTNVRYTSTTAYLDFAAAETSLHGNGRPS